MSVMTQQEEKEQKLMKIKRLKENAIIPTKGSEGAAGYDLYAALDQNEILINPGQNFMIDTGWSMKIPDKYFGAIFARSGLATKYGLRPANCVGIIDSDYRGPVKVVLHNDSSQVQTITNGERIAQLILIPYCDVEFKEVEELDETERGIQGFGSTGKF